MQSITEEDFEKGPLFWEDFWVQDQPLEHRARYIRKKEFANFYSSDDYVKDKLTNRMVAAPTRRTCENYGGFVCKVRHCDSQHYSSSMLLEKFYFAF